MACNVPRGLSQGLVTGSWSRLTFPSKRGAPEISGVSFPWTPPPSLTQQVVEAPQTLVGWKKGKVCTAVGPEHTSSSPHASQEISA